MAVIDGHAMIVEPSALPACIASPGFLFCSKKNGWLECMRVAYTGNPILESSVIKGRYADIECTDDSCNMVTTPAGKIMIKPIGATRCEEIEPISVISCKKSDDCVAKK